MTRSRVFVGHKNTVAAPSASVSFVQVILVNFRHMMGFP